jgi:hypothetical protein
MGQAKNRGSYDERVVQAQKRAELEQAEKVLAKAAAEHARAQRLAELPPEARRRAMERQRVKNLRLASLMALSLAFTPIEKEPTNGR